MTIKQALQRAAMVAAAAWCLLAAAQDSRPVVLGQSVALTGPQSAIAKAYHDGARVYFERVNAAGGVNGRRIELVALDDAGQAENAFANTRRLLDEGALALFGYFGSAPVTSAYRAIKDTDIPLFAPMAGAEELTGSLFPNVYALRPGYAFETAAIVRHALTLGTKRFAIVHASDPESVAALETGEPTMAAFGTNLLAKVPLDQVQRAMAAQPDSLLVISDAAAAAKVIREARSRGFRGTIYAYSTAGESLLADQLGKDGAGVVVARMVPKSDAEKVPLVREFLTDIQRANLGKPNVYMLEGYIAARALVEALRRVPPREQLTRARLRKAIESLDNVMIGGFRVHFADGRVGSRLVELSFIDSQGRIRE